jgi:DNA-binding MarR family transcriptional regulator
MKIEEEIKANFKDERFKAMINLKFTSNWLNLKHNKALEQFGISLPQYNILRILRGAKGEALSVSSIRERMVERSPNTTRLMDKLIEKKMIERVRCLEDRRVIYVKITQNGFSFLEKIDESFENQEDVMRKINLNEARQLNEILDKIRS